LICACRSSWLSFFSFFFFGAAFFFGVGVDVEGENDPPASSFQSLDEGVLGDDDSCCPTMSSVVNLSAFACISAIVIVGILQF
tara:strand:- start:38 stop:286 length:249 start_codon:yes stop_codon:yes gene_type:complete